MTRSTAARISPRIRSRSLGSGWIDSVEEGKTPPGDFTCRRRLRRARRSSRCSVRARQWSVSARAYSGQGSAAGATPTGTIVMQFTGHGGRHSSQPEHSFAITVCISLRAPRMASTGQASRHLRQPMQRASSITARARGLCKPKRGLSGLGAVCRSAASAWIVTPSPGGH